MDYAALMDAMDWDDLRFFLAVARGGSFSAAASDLGVTQPTVGRRLQAFEQRLQARLFVSTSKGQRLSATGERLLGHAERMEAAALAAAHAATGRDAGVRGRVCITASEWIVDRVLAPVIGPLLAAHPGLEIELIADARHLSLVRREADIAIRPSRVAAADIVERPLAEVAFGLYASDAYLAAYGAPDFAAGASGHALIAMSADLTKIPDVAWLPDVAGRAHVVARANGRLPMVTLAQAGVGIACLPRSLGDRAGLRLLPAPSPPVRTLWMASHMDTRTLPRVRRTRAFLSEAFVRLRSVLAPAL